MKKTTKRSLLLSALSLLLCMAMLVGSTFAWFTDSVTSDRNTIVSGQLDVELYYATWNTAEQKWNDYAKVNADTKMFNENALYEPGYTEVVKFKVVNEGTLALKYSLDAKIYGETAGKNVYEETFNLSDYLYTGTLSAANYTREAAVAAATTKLSTGFNMKATTVLQPETAEELVLVLTMPTSVGNEANHIDGFQPKIDLGITLVATQATYEADDFDNLYDAEAALPLNLSASAAVNANGTNLAIAAPGTKLPAITAVVPGAAVAAGATSLTLNVQEQANVLEGITVSADQAATTYDIEITGVAEGNTAPIVVTLDIGAGLTNVVLYHNAAPIASTYNPVTGILTFETTGFSPFTVVCDAAETYNVATATELAQAAANIKAGGTIVLTANITVETGVTFEKDVTLDLNGKTLAANVNKGRALKVAAGVNFVLDAEGSNVTFGNGTYGVIEQLAGGNTSITVNGGTFAGTTDYGAFVKLRGGLNLSVTLNDVNYTDNCALGNPLNAFVSSCAGASVSGINYVVNGGVYNVPVGFNIVGGKLTLNGVTLNVRGSGIEADDADIIDSKIDLDPGAYVFSIEGACLTASNAGVINVKNSVLTSKTYAFAFGGVEGTTSTTNNTYLVDCTVSAPTINAYPQYGTAHFTNCNVTVTE